jgi:Tfp pilus assembly protein PilF
MNSADPKLLSEAESALKRSVELNPQYHAYSNLSYLYLVEERYSDATVAAEKALEFGKDDYRAWAILASAYQWMGWQDKAAAAREQISVLLERAIKLNPQDAEAQASLASEYAHQGLADKAHQRIKTALALNSEDPIVLSEVSAAYEILLDRRNALTYANQALTKGLTLQDLRVDPDMQALIKDPHLVLPLRAKPTT